MLGLDWSTRGSAWRGLVWVLFMLSITVVPIITGLHIFVFQPMIDKINQNLADSKAKIKAELNSINNMNCQQLHDKLLNSDHFYDSDNEAVARDHYVAQCGVRLP